MFSDDRTFRDFSFFIGLENVNSYSIAACCFFFPFRILSYLAHLEYFSPAKTVLNTVCRTAPGILVYIIISLIISLGWACGFLVALNSS
jgi:hypothetical protein